jgi:hypothetical protein
MRHWQQSNINHLIFIIVLTISKSLDVQTANRHHINLTADSSICLRQEKREAIGKIDKKEAQ